MTIKTKMHSFFALFLVTGTKLRQEDVQKILISLLFMLSFEFSRPLLIFSGVLFDTL